MQEIRLFLLALASACLVSVSNACLFVNASVAYSSLNPVSKRFHAPIF